MFPEKGQYGAFVGCLEHEMVAWQYDQNFVKGKWNSTECIAQGGTIQTPSSVASDCEVLLQQAGPDGTGTVTYTPLIPTGSGNEIQNNKDSLTRAQGIGISVGAVLVSILLAMILFYVRLRRKQNAKSVDTGGFLKVELPGSSAEQHIRAVINPSNQDLGRELDGQAKVELDADVPKEREGDCQPELAADVPHEIEGEEKHEMDAAEKVDLVEVIHEMSATPIHRERPFSFDRDADTIIKS
jgi:hypothetical protein